MVRKSYAEVSFCMRLTLNPHTQKPAYAAPKIVSARYVSATRPQMGALSWSTEVKGKGKILWPPAHSTVRWKSLKTTHGLHFPRTLEIKNAPNPASMRKNADFACFQLRAT